MRVAGRVGESIPVSGGEATAALFSVPAAGGETKLLTDGLRAAFAGRWSPDGSEILFQTNRNGNDDIAAVPVEGGPVRMIVDSPLDERIHDVARDGTLVYFAIPPDNQIVRVGVEPLLERPGK